MCALTHFDRATVRQANTVVVRVTSRWLPCVLMFHSLLMEHGPTHKDINLAIVWLPYQIISASCAALALAVMG